MVRGVAPAVGALVLAGLIGSAPALGAGAGTPPAAGAVLPMGTTSPTGTPTPTPTDSVTPTPTPTETPTTTPTPTPTETLPPDVLAPDLVSMRPWGLYVTGPGSVRRLRFTSALGNIGDGPLELRPNRLMPCPAGEHNAAQILYRDGNGNRQFNRTQDTAVSRHRAGCMVYHRFHKHWHLRASARYTLFDPSSVDRVVVSTRRKVSFCMRDSGRLPRRLSGARYPESYGTCTKWTAQGISVGWMDVYQSFLAGQSLRLPRRLPDGVYCLSTVVDPLDQLVETRNDNNSSVRAFALKGDRIRYRDASRCE